MQGEDVHLLDAVQAPHRPDPHPVRLAEPRDLAADPAHTDDTQGLALEPGAEHEGRLQPPRLTPPDQPVALGDPAQEVEHQRDRELGGRVGEDAGRIRHRHAAARRLGEVDVVEPDRVLRHDPELRPRPVEELGVDAVGRHRHCAVGTVELRTDVEEEPELLFDRGDERDCETDAWGHGSRNATTRAASHP